MSILKQIESACWLALLLALLAPVQATSPVLPSLAWVQRSDWVNVKSAPFSAAGDGTTDDTAAISVALAALSSSVGGTKVLYFPTGTYKISSTLTLSNRTGIALIGTGSSVIKWAGSTGGTMYRSDGVTYSRYVGLTWDGSGTAAVGIDHQSTTLYETRIRHRDELFKNFTEAGVRVGYNQSATGHVPSAEMMYDNCLFQSNGTGVEFLTYNDYDNYFSGCDFRDNAKGIDCQQGNFQARECHFERNSFADMTVCPHSFEVLRCTSTGSNQFLYAAGGGPATCECLVEDCAVSGWTWADTSSATTNIGANFGAINFGLRGPLMVFDCTFTSPPAGTVNAINLATHVNDYLSPANFAPYVGLGFYLLQTALVSNNSPAGVTSGASSHIISIPWTSGTNRAALVTDATHSFFKTTENVSGAVYDAKTGYGAHGDGTGDDTAAVQAAINAAAAAGGGAIAYLPAGTYNISAPLIVKGGNYTFGGTGVGSQLNWLTTSTSAGPQVSVIDPQSITLEQFSFNSGTLLWGVCEVLQCSTGGPSSVTYDTVRGASSFLGVSDGAAVNPTNFARGLECVNLSPTSVVNLTEFDGNLYFYNSCQATILGGFTVDGALKVAGAAYSKTGYLGILARSSSGNPCDVIVRDNQDLTMTSFYTEQTNTVLSVSGDGAYSGLPGHVTIAAAQVAPRLTNYVNVNNYEGRISLLGAVTNRFQDQTLADIRAVAALNQYTYTASGARPSTLISLGTSFFWNAPTISSANYTSLGCNIADGANDLNASYVPYVLAGVGSVTPASIAPGATLSTGAQSAMANVAATLDDLRLLGGMDLAINYQYPSATLPSH